MPSSPEHLHRQHHICDVIKTITRHYSPPCPLSSGVSPVQVIIWNIHVSVREGDNILRIPTNQSIICMSTIPSIVSLPVQIVMLMLMYVKERRVLTSKFTIMKMRRSFTGLSANITWAGWLQSCSAKY